MDAGISLNRIIKPDIPVSDFIQFAADCGCSAVELRNDLSDPGILGGESSDDINRQCTKTGVTILTINALQRFNDPLLFTVKYEELSVLITEAKAVGCNRIVLCPVNDPEDGRSAAEQKRDLVAALKLYAPLFEKNGTQGLIEPLGFSICSVRFKEEAVQAIRECGFPRLYKIVHDTFHHYLSGETRVFGAWTGLIHVSGMHSGKNRGEATDNDRVLVDREDVMENQSQIRQLYQDGCSAPLSFEPFSSKIQNLSLPELKKQLENSMEILNPLFK